MRFGLLILVCAAAAAAADDSLIAKGYEHFYNLEYDHALAEFIRYTDAEPDDPNGHNHVAEAILYRDMFRAGALETELVTGNNPFLRRPKVDASPEDQRQFDSSITRALELSRAGLNRDPRDTGALYASGISYGLRANYDFLVRKAWRDALRGASAARKAHALVTQIDPADLDARMVQGLHDYVIGSLPLQWRLLGFLVGFHGDKQEGIHWIERVAADGKRNRVDAEFLLCAVYRREKQPERAVSLVESLMRRFPRNYLLGMELAQIYSDLGHKRKALAALERLRELKKSGVPSLRSLPEEKICFAEGNIEFWYNDLDAALLNLKQAAAAARELDLNTGVLAWMRIGQIYDLKGEHNRATEAYRNAITFAPESDAAKESEQYITAPYHRKTKA